MGCLQGRNWEIWNFSLGLAPDAEINLILSSVATPLFGQNVFAP